MSPLPWTPPCPPSHPPVITDHWWAKLPELDSCFPLAISLTHTSVHMSMLLSQFISPSPSPTWFTCLFSRPASLFLPCIQAHLYCFSWFHPYTLTYDICLSLPHLLHSVWQTLGPSVSLQITQSRFFLWLSDSPLYLCTTSSLPITVRLLPCAGDRKQCCNKHWGTCVFLNCFSRVMHSVVGLLDHVVVLFFTEPPWCSPSWLYQFTFPPTAREGSLFSTSSPAFIVCKLRMMAILIGVRWYLIVVWFPLLW